MTDELTVKEQKWVRRLEKTLKAQPKTITVLVRHTTIEICRQSDIDTAFAADGHLDYVEPIQSIKIGQGFRPDESTI